MNGKLKLLGTCVLLASLSPWFIEFTDGFVEPHNGGIGTIRRILCMAVFFGTVGWMISKDRRPSVIGVVAAAFFIGGIMSEMFWIQDFTRFGNTVYAGRPGGPFTKSSANCHPYECKHGEKLRSRDRSDAKHWRYWQAASFYGWDPCQEIHATKISRLSAFPWAAWEAFLKSLPVTAVALIGRLVVIARGKGRLI